MSRNNPVSSVFSSLLKFINYWYFRYIMVTELYILESWERVLIRKLNRNLALSSVDIRARLDIAGYLHSRDVQECLLRASLCSDVQTTNFPKRKEEKSRAGDSQASYLAFLFVLDIVLFAVFLLQWVFNYAVILPITAKLVGIDIGISQSISGDQLVST